MKKELGATLSADARRPFFSILFPILSGINEERYQKKRLMI